MSRPTPNGVVEEQGPAMTATTNNKMPSVKLRVFDGSRKPGDYREWKREMQATQMLYELSDPQMSQLLYLALEPGANKPRELLDDIDIDDVGGRDNND